MTFSSNNEKGVQTIIFLKILVRHAFFAVLRLSFFKSSTSYCHISLDRNKKFEMFKKNEKEKVLNHESYCAFFKMFYLCFLHQIKL